MAWYKTKNFKELHLGYPHWDESQDRKVGNKGVDGFKEYILANWLLVYFSRSVSGEKAGRWQASAGSG